MPPLAGGLSRARTAGFTLLNRTVPWIRLGTSSTCAEAVVTSAVTHDSKPARNLPVREVFIASEFIAPVPCKNAAQGYRLIVGAGRIRAAAGRGLAWFKRGLGCKPLWER